MAQPRASLAAWGGAHARPLAHVLLALCAVLLYTQNLGDASRLVLDEKIYVPAAYQMSKGIWDDPCWDGAAVAERPGNWVHPPLAKEIMAASLAAFRLQAPWQGCLYPFGPGAAHGRATTPEFNAFSNATSGPAKVWAWRVPSVLFGVAAVACLALAAERITRSLAAGLLAGSLLLLDGVAFVAARVAMLDVFMVGFAMAALLAATHTGRRAAIVAGAFLGLAFACKFTALFLGLPVLLVALWCRHRAQALERRSARDVLVPLLGLPPLVLVASYAPWWATWVPAHGVGWSVAHWLRLQAMSLGLLGGNGFAATDASSPLSWLVLQVPVLVYGASVGGGRHEFIYSMGNPALWWAAFAAAAAAVVRGVRGRRFGWLRQALRPAGAGAEDGAKGRRAREQGARLGDETLAMLGVAALLAYAPYLLLARTSSFLYYMEAVVPLLALVLAAALARLWSHGGARRAAAVAVVALAVVAFVHYFPLLDAWDMTLARRRAILHVLPWTRV